MVVFCLMETAREVLAAAIKAKEKERANIKEIRRAKVKAKFQREQAKEHPVATLLTTLTCTLKKLVEGEL